MEPTTEANTTMEPTTEANTTMAPTTEATTTMAPTTEATTTMEATTEAATTVAEGIWSLAYWCFFVCLILVTLMITYFPLTRT